MCPVNFPHAGEINRAQSGNLWTSKQRFGCSHGNKHASRLCIILHVWNVYVGTRWLSRSWDRLFTFVPARFSWRPNGPSLPQISTTLSCIYTSRGGVGVGNWSERKTEGRISFLFLLFFSFRKIIWNAVEWEEWNLVKGCCIFYQERH